MRTLKERILPNLEGSGNWLGSSEGREVAWPSTSAASSHCGVFLALLTQIAAAQILITCIGKLKPDVYTDS